MEVRNDIFRGLLFELQLSLLLLLFRFQGYRDPAIS